MKTQALFLSIVLNIALGTGLFYVYGQRKHFPPPSPRPIVSELAATKDVWHASPADLYAQLREWGAPNDIIVSVLFARDRQEILPRRLKILYPNGVQRWNGSPRMDRDTLGRLADLYGERRALFRGLMGDDFDIALAKEDPVLYQKWGLSDARQIAEVKRITQRYEEIQIKSRVVNGELDCQSIAWDSKIHDSYAKDIRGVLGNGADDFLAFNSFEARSLQKTLSNCGIETTESQYLALLETVSDLRRAHLSDFHTDYDDVHSKNLERLRLFEPVLGPENVIKYASNQDYGYREIERLMTANDSSTRLKVCYEYWDILSRLGAVQNSRPSDIRKQVSMEGDRLYELLAKHIPEPSLRSFVNGPGRFVTILRNGGVSTQ